jgi:hypothetical protein
VFQKTLYTWGIKICPNYKLKEAGKKGFHQVVFYGAVLNIYSEVLQYYTLGHKDRSSICHWSARDGLYSVPATRQVVWRF